MKRNNLRIIKITPRNNGMSGVSLLALAVRDGIQPLEDLMQVMKVGPTIRRKTLRLHNIGLRDSFMLNSWTPSLMKHQLVEKVNHPLDVGSTILSQPELKFHCQPQKAPDQKPEVRSFLMQLNQEVLLQFLLLKKSSRVALGNVLNA